MRPILLGIPTLIALSCATAGYGLSIVKPVVPEEALDGFRLPRDSASLIRYLENGIPVEHVPLQREPHHLGPFVQNRFQYYQYIIQALVNTKTSEGVPILRRIEAGELAPVIEADLDIALAALDSQESWEDWHVFEQLRRDGLAVQASIAIQRIANESPVPLLRALLRERTEFLFQPYGNDRVMEQACIFFIDICKELTNFGSYDGIDALVSLLDSPNRKVRIRAARQLRWHAGLPIGPYEDTPEISCAADATKWRIWLAARRNAVSPLSLIPVDPELRRLPEAVTLRERLRNATDTEGIQRFVQDKTDWYWVRDNALANLSELREIATDRRERYGIRALALRFITQADLDSGIEFVIECLHDGSAGHLFHRTALNLVEWHYKDRYVEILTECIEGEWAASPTAIHMLAQDTERNSNLVEMLPRLSGDRLDAAVQSLFLPKDTPIAAIEYALAGDVPYLKARAMVLARDSEIRNKLSSKAVNRLDDWHDDPECRYWFCAMQEYWKLPRPIFETALKSFGPSDPRSGALYSGAMRRVGGPETTEGFVQCVEAYRLSRGRTQTLEQLGYR